MLTHSNSSWARIASLDRKAHGRSTHKIDLKPSFGFIHVSDDSSSGLLLSICAAIQKSEGMLHHMHKIGGV